MDVTITNGLEGVRQYFQGLPTASNTSENSSTFLAEQYSDNVENHNWPGNVQTASPSISTNEEPTRTTEKSLASFNHLGNNSSETFNSQSSNSQQHNESQQHKSVSLPTHEMRPHNHEIWKPSYEQRTSDIDNDKNSNNVQMDSVAESVEKLPQTEQIKAKQPAENDTIPLSGQAGINKPGDNVSKSSKEDSGDEYKRYLENELKSLSNNELARPLESEKTSQDDQTGRTSNSGSSISQKIEMPLKSADKSKSISIEPKTLEISANSNSNLPNEQLLTRQISADGKSNLENTQSHFQTLRSSSSEVRSLAPESQSKSIELKNPFQDIRSGTYEIKSQSQEVITSLRDIRPTSQEMRPTLHESSKQSLSQIRLPSHEMRPLSYEMMSPSHEMRPPSHEMRPPSHEMRPPSHEMRPPSQEMRPPSHEMRPSSQEMRPSPYEIRPPSQELRPSPHEIRPPSQEMRPSPHEIRQSSHELRSPSHEMRPPSHEMRPPSHEMRPPSHEMRPSSHEMRPPSHEMRPPSHEMRPASQEMRFSAHEMKMSHELRFQPSQEMQMSSDNKTYEARSPLKDMRSRSQDIKYLPQDKRIPLIVQNTEACSYDGRPNSYEMKAFSQNVRPTSIARHPSQEMQSSAALRPTSQESMNKYEMKNHLQTLEDNRFVTYDHKNSQSMVSQQNVRSSSQSTKLPPQSSQEYLKSIQYKSSMEARMTKSINQAFNENRYFRPMTNDTTQLYQDSKMVNDNKYPMDTNSMYVLKNTKSNELKTPTQQDLHLIDSESKKSYNRTVMTNDINTRIPYDNRTQSSGDIFMNSTRSVANDTGRLKLNKANLTSNQSNISANYQTYNNRIDIEDASLKREYMKKIDPNNYAKSIGQFNKNPSADVPRSVSSEGRPMLHLRANNVDNAFHSQQNDKSKQYLEHKLPYPSIQNTQISRQDHQIPASQTHLQNYNCSENYRLERKDVSLPSHDMQASFNDIRPTFNQVNTLMQVDPSKLKHQNPHSDGIRYEPPKQNVLVNDKIIGGKLKEIRVGHHESYPQSQHLGYSRHNQPAYTTSAASYSTSTQEKNYTRTDNYQNLPKTSQNSSVLAYSRSYNYPGGIAASNQHSVNAAEYNIPPNQSQYMSKAINHLQESQTQERQRLAAYSSQQMVQKNSTHSNNQQNSSNYNGSDSNPYSQNQVHHMRMLESSSRSVPMQAVQIQEHQTPQNSSHSYQSTKSYITTTKNMYSARGASGTNQIYDRTNIPSNNQARHEIIATSGNVSTSQYPIYSHSSQTEHQMQHYIQKGSPYQQHTNNILQNQSLQHNSKRSLNVSPIASLPVTNYPTSRYSRDTLLTTATPMDRQKLANQTANTYNTITTPHLAFKASENTSSNSYKYATSSTATSISQYHSNNGQVHSYITTNAPMSNYTTTSSVNTFKKSSTSATSNNPQSFASFPTSKPALQEDMIKRQPTSQVHSKVLSNQQHLIKSNFPGPTKGRTIDLTTANALGKINSVSPLDLSVKTVRTSADSTANDDYQIIENSASESMLPQSTSYNLINPLRMPNSRPLMSTGIAPKVDFSPNFTTTHLSQPISSRTPIQNHKYVRDQNLMETQVSSKQITGKKDEKSISPNKPYENRTAYYQNYHLQRNPSANDNLMKGSSANKRLNPNIPQAEFSSSQSQYITQSSHKDVNKKRSLEIDGNNEYHSHSKFPRVDNWRLSIDQEIDQRLMSYTHSKAQEIKQPVHVSKPLVNGHLVSNATYSMSGGNEPFNPQYQSLNEQSKSNDPKSCQQSQATKSHSIPTSQYNTNLPNSISSSYQLSQHQANAIAMPVPPQKNTYNKPQQMKATNNTNSGADKRVISILRNSLEIKGAKEAKKRIEQERMVNSEVQNVQSYPQPPTDVVSAPTMDKCAADNVLNYNSNLGANKFHFPRAIDSINKLGGENELELKTNEKTEIRSTGNKISNADLDGLAANLAARIRTKAELKQVDPAQLAAMQKNNIENSQQDLPTFNSTETASSKEQNMPVVPPRRRLFSRTDDDNGSNSVPHRNSTLRSSSEASVFDFRESDSEGEMPILERQSLIDMRRDRKSLTKPPSITNLTDLDVVIKTEIPESPDPLFIETCDKFLEQLRTGGSSKKRGRRKKVVEPEIIAKLENTMKNQQLVEIEIKVEKCDDIIKSETERMEITPQILDKTIDNDLEINVADIKQEDSDSDVPLIRKKYNNAISDSKKGDVDDDDDDDDDVLGIVKKKEKSGAKIKLESSSESSDSENENERASEHSETVAQRLRQRKCRSSEKRSDSETSPNSRTTNEASQKNRSKSAPQKKPSFGDGSDFRPGWEEEVYRYKQSLRMPVQLINIPRPARLSTSLPDLDPCPSPTTSSLTDNEFFNNLKSFNHMKTLLGSNKIKREFDSDLDSNFSFSLSQNKNVDDEEATCSSILSSASKINQKENNNSIVDVLAQRYGKNIRKRSKKSNNNTPKIIPKSSNALELLPTPSLENENASKEDEKQPCKKSKKKKHCTDKTLSNSSSSNLLGFFRKKTVENFRDAFCKNPINEQFTPIIFKSRTRKETQVLKQRATMREVFGEDRPASAPPMTNHNQSNEPKAPLSLQKKRKATIVKVTSKSKKENTVPGRAGLRSAIVLRGHRSIIKTKRQIVNPNKKQLLKSLNVKKLRSEVKGSKTSDIVTRKEKILKDQKQFKTQKGSMKNRKLALKSNNLKANSKSAEKKGDAKTEEKSAIKIENASKDKVSNNKQAIKIDKDIKIEKDIENENDIKTEKDIKIDDKEVKPERKLGVKKKYKLKSIRRKFSSGFDYIRKKKKPLKKENIESDPKPKKRGVLQRTNAVTIQDIQREIKGWVLNKGVGETHLHRASRLGYTDITAYCLETLGNAPSPKDNAGYTPLHEACSRGHLDIAKLLLLYGANQNEFAQGGIRPLHEASENGYVEIIRLLLSYGADPLFPTYSGLTPLSLAQDNDTLSVLQNYIADIQGKDAPPWIFNGPAQFFDTEEQGYDVLEGAPSPDPSGPNAELDMEVCEAVFPNLYTLRGENPDDKWVLLQDLSNILKVKSKDALLRQLNTPPSSMYTHSPSPINHKSIVKEMKMADFLDQAHCCSLLSAGERVNIRASKISLVKYSDRVKELLDIEDYTLPPTR